MRSNGNTCRAIAAGGAGLLALGLLALGLAIGYLTSSHNPRTTSSTTSFNTSKLSSEEQDKYNKEVLPISNEEYVVPMKKRHLPLHHMDIIYPHENSQKEDTHYSGHFRGRTAAIWDPHPEYEFTGFGRSFHLDLSQNEDLFVLPNLKVTHVYENMTTQEEPNLRAEGCFYTGTVRGDPGSAVSVNLCHGMTGHIRTSTGSYLIEPVESWQGYDKPLKHSLRRITSKLIHDHCQHHHHHHHHNHHNDQHNGISETDEEVGDETINYKKTEGSTRKKRSLSEEYFIEMMIVADKKMKDYHGSNLLHYVLTLMSVVSSIFKDASIGNRMSIAIVKFRVLEHQELILGKKHNTSSSEMLTNFCRWQQNYYDRNRSTYQHHDTALLLTRENVCYELRKETCDTLGLAELGTMCKPDRSCSLVKDNGLNAAFTIAHEIGHVLNMPHDEDIKCQQYEKREKRHYVMARELDEKTTPWEWSNCSRHFLTEFLDAGSGSCLKDHPTKDLLEEERYSKDLPGEHFSADKQCQLIYGPGSKMCRIYKESICEKLWCFVKSYHQENGTFCKTQHMPWADGTPCDAYKWCQRGRCVVKDKRVLKPVNGGWGSWQRYKECSRSCGGGVKQSIRYCNNPAPSNGGKYCIGQRIRYRSCATQECPSGTPDFREQQCAKFNNMNFKIPNLAEDVKWVPKYGGISPENRCKLFCRVAGSTSYYALKEKVIDGTVCSHDTYDICVNGVCRPAGCDHVLNSSKELDDCGQCNGNNSNCQRKNGSYTHSRYGYSVVIRIHAGSANIDIRQIGYNFSKDDNYLALKDSDTYEYILNGNFVVSMFEKRFLYGDTILQYSGSSETIERINSTRPLTKDLIVEVLSVGNLTPPNIRYEYSIQKQKYKWELSDVWTRCNKLCNGEKQETVKCLRTEDRAEVSQELCDANNKPNFRRKPCNTFCNLRWNITGKSACSTPCGFGERTISIQCVLEDNLTGESTPVDNSSCEDISRPSIIERCRGACDKARWVYGTWSSCSVTCGNGTETRSAECLDHSGRITRDKECDENGKEVQRPCWAQHCPVWKVGEWTPCSVSCGKGVQRRPYRCMVGNRTDNSQCPLPIPHHIQHCESAPCPYWITGAWSPCSVTCGTGEQSRNVECSKENACSLRTIPPTTQTCVMQPCSFKHENAVPDDINGNKPSSEKYGDYFWKESETPCSVTCGKGWKTRYSTCHEAHTGKVVSNILCPENFGDALIEKEVCVVPVPCPSDHYGVWNTSKWEPCSAICGTGFKKRSVYCQSLDGNYLPERFCSGIKPINEIECVAPCTWNNPWTVSSWSDCSEPCGGGIRTRSVTCEYSECSGKYPDDKEPCNIHSCIEGNWHYGPWSSCNVSCGTGYRQREVKCKSTLGGDLPEKACKDKYFDATMEICYSNNCRGPLDEPVSTRWRTSRWSPCSSSTCTQTREVWCESSAGTTVPRTKCSGKRIPKSVKPCKKRHCTQHTSYRKSPYHWKRGPWSQCLGKGEQTRTVTCVHVKEQEEIPVNDSHCKQKRPLARQWCSAHRDRNEMFHWRTGEWKQCNKPCSRKGHQERKLYCFMGNREVPRSHCKKNAAEPKPEKKRRCPAIICTSCRERQLGLFERNDGEYLLHIRGASMKIYCHGMNTDNPQEFISLREQTNFATFYDRSIKEPEGGENCHWDSCRLQQSGVTHFRKIAINVSSFIVNREDLTFAENWGRSMVKYAEAGDCIMNSGRSEGCQVQGEFQIDLRETGFRIHPSSDWDNQGADMAIVRSDNDVRIFGRCGGGCCGFCRPRDPLRLDLVPP